MNKREIVVEGVYSNGKEGRFYAERKVIDISKEGKYRLCETQKDNETVLYKTIKGYNLNQSGRMTLSAFASWAKERIS